MLPKEIESIFESQDFELCIRDNPIKYYDGNNLFAIGLHQELGNWSIIIEEDVEERFFEQLKGKQKLWNLYMNSNKQTTRNTN